MRKKLTTLICTRCSTGFTAKACVSYRPQTLTLVWLVWIHLRHWTLCFVVRSCTYNDKAEFSTVAVESCFSVMQQLAVFHAYKIRVISPFGCLKLVYEYWLSLRFAESWTNFLLVMFFFSFVITKTKRYLSQFFLLSHKLSHLYCTSFWERWHWWNYFLEKLTFALKSLLGNWGTMKFITLIDQFPILQCVNAFNTSYSVIDIYIYS